MNKGAMFSSETDQWETPQDFFNKLDDVFRFDIDVCADSKNAKTELFYTKTDDGLTHEWFGTCWMNPPYGREIQKWVEKAYKSAKQNGATVVCLLPARVDTKWWHEYCKKGEIYFVKGRLKFGKATNSAPFPSAVVVFRPKIEDAMI